MIDFTQHELRDLHLSVLTARQTASAQLTAIYEEGNLFSDKGSKLLKRLDDLKQKLEIAIEEKTNET